MLPNTCVAKIPKPRQTNTHSETPTYLPLTCVSAPPLLTRHLQCPCVNNQSVALRTYTRLNPTCVRWSRKLNFPTKFHAGHLSPLQSRIFGTLAKIPPALSAVVTMTGGSQKRRQGRFYGSSGLHLNDSSSAALVKRKAFNFSSKILQSVSIETLQYVFLQNQFEPSVCVCDGVCMHLCVFQWTTSPPWKGFTSNR